MFRKKIFLSLGFIVSLPAHAGILDKSNISAPTRLLPLSIQHTDEGFMVDNGEDIYSVKPYNLDKELREINSEQLAKLLATGAYLSVNNAGDNEYTIRLQHRLLGGGVIGANIGFWVGRFTVYLGAAIVVGAVTAVSGPGGVALAATIAPVVEGIATAGAVGGGIIGGVVTGPV